MLKYWKISSKSFQYSGVQRKKKKCTFTQYLMDDSWARFPETDTVFSPCTGKEVVNFLIHFLGHSRIKINCSLVSHSSIHIAQKIITAPINLQTIEREKQKSQFVLTVKDKLPRQVLTLRLVHFPWLQLNTLVQCERQTWSQAHLIRLTFARCKSWTPPIWASIRWSQWMVDGTATLGSPLLINCSMAICAVASCIATLSGRRRKYVRPRTISWPAGSSRWP